MIKNSILTVTARESLVSLRFWVRLGTWILAFVVVLRAMSYLQSGGLVHILGGSDKSETVPTAYQSRTAHIITEVRKSSNGQKKDH